MITAIIPVYELDAERKRNLEFVYERLVFSNFEIIWINNNLFIPSGLEIKKIKSGKKFFVIPIAIDTSDFSHANILIIDNENKNWFSKYWLVQMLRLCQFGSIETGSNRIFQFIQFLWKQKVAWILGFKKGVWIGKSHQPINEVFKNKSNYNEPKT